MRGSRLLSCITCVQLLAIACSPLATQHPAPEEWRIADADLGTDLTGQAIQAYWSKEVTTRGMLVGPMKRMPHPPPHSFTPVLWEAGSPGLKFEIQSWAEAQLAVLGKESGRIMSSDESPGGEVIRWLAYGRAEVNPTEAKARLVVWYRGGLYSHFREFNFQRSADQAWTIASTKTEEVIW